MSKRPAYMIPVSLRRDATTFAKQQIGNAKAEAYKLLQSATWRTGWTKAERRQQDQLEREIAKIKKRIEVRRFKFNARVGDLVQVLERGRIKIVTAMLCGKLSPETAIERYQSAVDRAVTIYKELKKKSEIWEGGDE